VAAVIKFFNDFMKVVLLEKSLWMDKCLYCTRVIHTLWMC